jgi:hypothetical protein
MSEINEIELLNYVFINKIEGAFVECGVHEGLQ